MLSIISNLIELPGIQSFQYNIKDQSYVLNLEDDLTVKQIKEIVRSIKEDFSRHAEKIEVVSLLGESGIVLKLTEKITSYSGEDLN